MAWQGLIGVGADGAEGLKLLGAEAAAGFGALVVQPDAELVSLSGWEVVVFGLISLHFVVGFPPRFKVTHGA